MSKIYLYSQHTKKDKPIILELSTSKEVKDALEQIKEHYPKISLNISGAKDLETFKRTQRTIPAASSTFFTTTEEFIGAVASLTNKNENWMSKKETWSRL